MSFKLISTVICLFVLLTSCSRNEMTNHNVDSEDLVKVLKDKNDKLNQRIIFLEKQIKDLQGEKSELKDEIVDLKNSQGVPTTLAEIPIWEEGFFFHPKLIYPKDFSIEQIIDFLGKPVRTRDYVEEAHSGLDETELIYENASFTFQFQEENPVIKWLSIKENYFMTQRGIQIGSTKEQVLEAYGQNYWLYGETEDRTTKITYGEKRGIRFTLTNDLVTEISIWYMYE